MIDEEIKPSYISIPAAVAKINTELDLDYDKLLTKHDVWRWRYKKLIPTTKKRGKLSMSEIKHIKEITILHKVLGVPLSRIKDIEDHVRREKLIFRDSILNIIEKEDEKFKIKLKIKHLYV